jgi:TPR repeat protein
MDMARIEIPNADYAPMGAAIGSDALFQLGMRCAVAAATPDDRVAAHKWFNIAAMQGNEKAAQLRREIAEEMSPSEIAAAQRAARNWITHH